MTLFKNLKDIYIIGAALEYNLDYEPIISQGRRTMNNDRSENGKEESHFNGLHVTNHVYL